MNKLQYEKHDFVGAASSSCTTARPAAPTPTATQLFSASRGGPLTTAVSSPNTKMSEHQSTSHTQYNTSNNAQSSHNNGITGTKSAPHTQNNGTLKTQTKQQTQPVFRPGDASAPVTASPTGVSSTTSLPSSSSSNGSNKSTREVQSVRTAGDFAWPKGQWREAAVRQITAERL
eukprot:TRINITY_DN9901_c0_g1_i1.p1 TRINITY_DN9901_c0_g1~~TRINITY_DN9901_c0_g1_i1.p1  ORF type:complete len:174 (-),score=29.91 TRINITY_DN9901_c0_g1_i1:23-544(-)